MSEKTALLIIDMQKDFMAMVAGAPATIPAVKTLIALGREKDWRIIYIVRAHDKSGIDAEKFREPLFAKGGVTVKGSEGAEIVDELAPQPGDLVINKSRFSAFFGTNLDMVLRRIGCRRLVICGTQYPNCIRATAMDALALDYDVIVCTSATSAASEAVARANIHDLEHMGIQCLPLEQMEEL